MAESNAPEHVDDLDAFFSAAAKSDMAAVEKAAETVAGVERRVLDEIPKKKGTRVADKNLLGACKPAFEPEGAGESGDKFVAVEPDAPAGAKGEPFVLIPANSPALFPWWVWATIAASLAVLVMGLVFTPEVAIDRITARLGDSDSASVQSAMRTLVIRGDERTVGKLYDIAVSRRTDMERRLRAVDTLGLIQTPDAEHALLRLELSDTTDSRVRMAAIAARRQREAARTSERGR